MEPFLITGTYHNGEVLLDELPQVSVSERVRVTFIPYSDPQSLENPERYAEVQRIIALMRQQTAVESKPFSEKCGIE